MPKTHTVDERAVVNVLRMPFPAVVAELVLILGPKTTAVLGDVTDTKYVRAWESGIRGPRGFTEARLRAALQATRILAMSDGPVIAKAWWYGTNPFFEDKSPVEVLLSAEFPDTTTLTRVVRAARSTATS